MKPALVIEASPWTITNKETGAVERTGFTLTYIDGDSPHIGRKRGYEPLRISGSDDMVKPHIDGVPGFFHLQYRMRANRDTGKAELALAAMSYAGPLSWAGDDERLAHELAGAGAFANGRD
jgi:hypothetical protein